MNELRRHWVSLTVSGIVWMFAWAAFYNSGRRLDLLPAFVAGGLPALLVFARSANR